MTVINPAGFRLNSHPPPVEVEELHYHLAAAYPKARSRQARDVMREVRFAAPFPNSLRLPAGSYGLDLEIAALSFSAPEKVRLESKLEGIDRDWEDVGILRIATFHKLPPGQYVFRVRAANNDGVWNETGTSLALTVHPVFGQTWGCRAGTGLLLIALGGASVWSWSRRRVAGAVERERVATEMQQLHAELAHSGRISTMGQLASALAHELSQPLGAILRNAEAAELLIEQEPHDLAELRAILTDIRTDDQRAGGVIDRMRALLKRRNFERTPVQIVDMIGEVVGLIRSDALQRKIQLDVELAPNLPPVLGDRIQLQQVLLNLALNGMDAMKDQPPERRRLLLQARRSERAVIEVLVRDLGPGIPAPNLRRLFEPFFTTKPNGMGMGLAVSKTIIEAHQGTIRADNQPEGGACFCFTLPVANAARGNQ